MKVKPISNTFTSHFFIFILILFLIVFPKGGIRFGQIPLTWGYLFLGLTAIFVLIRKRYIFKKNHLFILLCMLPFQMYSLLSICINGYEHLGFTISFFTSFFALPFIFFFIFSEYIEHLDLPYLFKILKSFLFFVAFYGILLFFFKTFTGHFFEIPLLTINFHEKGLIEDFKNIDRTHLFKLISTYNNGNLYGICMLMFLPLYKYLEKSKFKKLIFKLALLLTLSRTVWVGLIISEILYGIFMRKNKHLAPIKTFLYLIFFITIICYIGSILGYPIHWYWEKSLGGRLQKKYFSINLFSHTKLMFIEEMVYLSILNTFGFTGLVLFLIALFSPLIIYLLNYHKISQQDNINKSIFLGLLTYVIIAFSDGAILYIPIMAFYWFLSSFLLKE